MHKMLCNLVSVMRKQEKEDQIQYHKWGNLLSRLNKQRVQDHVVVYHLLHQEMN